MSMTVGELKELLEDCGLPDHAEVRLAHQPRWAFEYSLAEPGGNECVHDGVLYLAEGTQLGYLPHGAAVAIGWSDPDDEDEDEDEDEEPPGKPAGFVVIHADAVHFLAPPSCALDWVDEPTKARRFETAEQALQIIEARKLDGATVAEVFE